MRKVLILIQPLELCEPLRIQFTKDQGFCQSQSISALEVQENFVLNSFQFFKHRLHFGDPGSGNTLLSAATII